MLSLGALSITGVKCLVSRGDATLWLIQCYALFPKCVNAVSNCRHITQNILGSLITFHILAPWLILFIESLL